IFGVVTQGMDVVKKIESIATDSSSRPVEPVRILKSYVKAE
ncbi:MAG: Cyclophilin type peptidyl-prolyl cis-trans isomerase/CLD, partial [Chlamydiota bacterium]